MSSDACSAYTASRGALILKNGVKIAETAVSGGKIEKEGPLGGLLDVYCDSDDLHTGTFEKAEAEMVRMTVNTLMAKAGVKDSNIDLLLAGDLMNQCTSTAYGLSEFDIPYMGLYGACSTFAEGLLTAALLIDAGHIGSAIVVASSNFCTAERQFRFPLEYGAVSGTTAQTTVTGAGALILSKSGGAPYVTHFTAGKIVDLGITDANNMGAAMAPAAADTLLAHFKDTGKRPEDYDLILSGDLGEVGRSILVDMMNDEGYDIAENYNDCGCMIFDGKKQDTHAGGSGCGCGASTLCGYVMNRMKAGELNRVLFMATGALLSPTSTLQGESIPSVAHAVVISNTGQEGER